MKTSLLFLASLVAVLSLAAAETPFDPASQYLDAFLLIQDGDAAVQKSDWSTGHAKFTAAQQILTDIKSQAARWNPPTVEFRLPSKGIGPIRQTASFYYVLAPSDDRPIKPGGEAPIDIQPAKE